MSEPEPPQPRLRRCDLAVCEGLCCHDGVWLTADDEQRIRAGLREGGGAFAHLPKVKITTVHTPTGTGRKTATHPHTYRQRPAHFTDTRCVFAYPDGRCSLQSAAVDAGLHPWTWKPLACWLHPLRIGQAGATLVAPPRRGQDPDAGEAYPGYTTFTTCGADHGADGEPWVEVLAEEQAWFAAIRARTAHDAG
ncbi:MAG: DUF3109 family protein [Myxococcales bacterium]|nr:DUF3109 family protein [Myxococcales bacterium]